MYLISYYSMSTPPTDKICSMLETMKTFTRNKMIKAVIHEFNLSQKASLSMTITAEDAEL